MSRIFISHSSKNNAEAIALREWLDENGWGREEIFLDIDPTRGLVAGERWQARLKEASHRCEAVLFVISPAWVASRWCGAEFLLAKTLGKKIFGAMVEPTPWDTLPPELTAEYQVVDLAAAGPKRDIEVKVPPDDALVTVHLHAKELLRLKGGLDKAGLDARTFAFDETRPIFRGLRALEEKDAAIFFGREGKIVEALDALRVLSDKGASKAFVILGASGAGKSSFLRAGLWPRLARDDRTFLTLPVVRPGQAAMTGESGLVVSLRQAGKALELPFTAGTIEAALGRSDGFAQLLAELQTAAQRRLVDEAAKPPLVVLPIDQGEELFNADAGSEAGEFLKLVCAQVKGPLMVLICMRSDAFERLQHAPQLAENNVDVTVFSLPPLPQGAFKEVIEGPVKRLQAAKGDGAIKLDPTLTTQLLVDMGGDSADALPLLAFVLERLYRKYEALTFEDYRASGGFQGAIVEAAAEAFKNPWVEPKIPEDAETQRELLRKAFIPYLARIDEKTGEARRRIAKLIEIPADARPLIERLVQVRLLIKHQPLDKDGKPDLEKPIQIEPAHEALLRQWPDLQVWLKEERTSLIQLEQLVRAAEDWEANGRQSEWVVHKAGRLTDAEALGWREHYLKALDGAPREYLRAARYEEDAARSAERDQIEREKKQLEQIAAAQKEREEAQRLISEHLSAQESAQHEREQALRDVVVAQARFIAQGAMEQALLGETESAVLLASEALRRVEVPQYAKVMGALHALRLAKLELRAQLVVRLHGAQVNSAMFSPDGSRVITASSDLTARIWEAATGREVVVLRGHRDWVRSAVPSPDGLLVLTVSDDATARVWSALTGEQIAVFDHGDQIESATFSPDCKSVVTACADGTARIWDAVLGKQVRVLEGHDDAVRCAVYSPDGKRIATASEDRTGRLWDAATGRQIAVLGGHGDLIRSALPALTLSGTGSLWSVEFLDMHDNNICYIAYSPDGRLILTASEDCTARLWEAATGRGLVALNGHEGAVRSAAFSPDSTSVVTVSDDNTAAIWGGADWSAIAHLSGHRNDVTGAAFSSDSSRVVTSSKDGTARLWDARTGRAIAVLRGHSDFVMSASFAADGRQVVTASWDNTARLWDAEESVLLQGHLGEVFSAKFSQDGARVVTASQDKTARLWDSDSGAALGTFCGHHDWVLSAAFSPDGRSVLTASRDRTARIWQLDRSIVLKGHRGEVFSARFSRDGCYVVTASEDRTAKIWDAISGAEIRTLQGHADQVTSAMFSPDDTLVITLSWDYTARLWDVATGKEVTTLTVPGGVRAIDFHPAGTHLVMAAGDRTARLWDIALARETLTLRGHQASLNLAAFSPNGALVATASVDKTVRLWEATAGKEVAILRRHTGMVLSMSFSPDGTRLTTTSDDGTAWLWDTTAGKEIAVLRGHLGKVHSAEFSADGRRVISASSDTRAQVWSVEVIPEELIDWAFQQRNFELSHEQRMRYLLNQ